MEKYQIDGKCPFSFFVILKKIYFYFGRRFPDYFYTFSLWQSDQQKKLVDFIMIDTVILCGGGNTSDWEHTPLKGPENNFVAEAYWQWIEEQLRQSTYGHNHI
jgi:hypothetical protein